MLHALAARAQDVRFAPGAVIVREGHRPRGWFIVLEGRVHIVRIVNGRQHVVHTEGPGETLGEVALFSDGIYPATVIASEATRCALLPPVALDAGLRASPELALVLAECLATCVKRLVELLDDRSVRGVRARLIHYLLTRPPDAADGTVTLGLTQQRVAELIGTVREVLARELRDLVRLGLVQRCGRSRYRITDPERLRHLHGAHE